MGIFDYDYDDENDYDEEESEEKRRERELADRYFNEGVSYYRSAQSYRDYNEFRTAQFRFQRALDLSYSDEFREDCEYYIKQCDDWMDSITNEC